MLQQPQPSTSYARWSVSLDWTEEEQRALDQHLARTERMDALQRYVKLAAALPRKSARDVALRTKWRAHHALLKKRKELAGAGLRKPGGPGLPQAPGGVPPYLGATLPQLPPDAAGGAIVDGPIAQLLDANFGILNQFRANMAAFKVAENTELLVAFRDNILSIINHMEAMGGVMAQMPQLPVRLNVDLANNFLPSRPAAVALAFGGGGGLPPPPQPSMNAPGMVPLSGIAPAGSGGPAPPPMQPSPKPEPGVGGGGLAVPLPPEPTRSVIVKREAA